VKRICSYLPIFVLLLACLPFASAQSGVDIAIGFGAVQNTASGNGLTIDTSQLSPTFGNFVNCNVGLGSTLCSPTSKMNSFAMGFSGDLMFWKHLGIGAEVAFAPAKQDYANFPATTTSAFFTGTAFTVKDRVTLYDFNGIYQPVKNERVALKLYGGFGGANIKFYETGTTSSALVGSQNFSQFFGSSNHFQLHGGAAVQIYVKGKLFIRPEFDVHWVNNMTQQFGRNTVTQEMVWIGYTLGGQ
jgi:hypothetical protein